MSGLFINEEDWINKNKHTSNSLIEREMREINRRTDVGCRWTDKGVYKIIKLLEIKKGILKIIMTNILNKIEDL